MFRVQCVVGSSPQRSGSLHRLALIGSGTANSILENSCLKTQPFFSSLFSEGILTENTQALKTLYPTVYSPPPPLHTRLLQFLPGSACCVFVRLPGNLPGDPWC